MKNQGDHLISLHITEGLEKQNERLMEAQILEGVLH